MAQVKAKRKYRIQTPAQAAVPEYLGYANYGRTVTGGEGGSELVATTSTNYISAMQTAGARTVKVTADIAYNGGNGSGTLKTIQGSKTVWSPNGKKITGIGHWLTGSSGGNLIFKNLVYGGSGYDTDTFRSGGGVEGVIWDHCTFGADADYWTTPPAEGAQADFDGIFDAGDNTTGFTFSNCRFHTYDKLMLLQNELGPKRMQITFYNCYFTGLRQRLPSVFNADMHFFNCFYEDTLGSGLGKIILHKNSKLLFEQCYVKNCPNVVMCWSDFVGTVDPRINTTNTFVSVGEVFFDGSGSVPPTYGTFEPAYRPALVENGLIKTMDLTLANQIKAEAGATLSL